MNYFSEFFTISHSARSVEGEMYSFGSPKNGGSDEK